MKQFTFRTLFLSLLLALSTGASTLHAQGLFDIFKKENVKETVKDVLGNVAGDYVKFSIVGEWKYEGATVDLKSSNELANIGSTVLQQTIDNKINEQLAKLGIKPENLYMTFNEDSTMVIKIGSRDFKGTYSYDDTNKRLNMKLANRIPINTNIAVEMSSISILYKADGLLNLLKGIGGKIGALESLTTLLKNYDNMSIGMKFSATDGRSLEDFIPKK